MAVITSLKPEVWHDLSILFYKEDDGKVHAYYPHYGDLEAVGNTKKEAFEKMKVTLRQDRFHSRRQKRNYYQLFTMMGKWYYVIRDKPTDKMVYSSKMFPSKSEAEKYAKKRTNLYNALARGMN